uniref:Uncharacterized protein n=1 Tax=Ornithorhynchus anatinus TaxID=9258 RepID=A0A6I8NSM3_ORNAN
MTLEELQQLKDGRGRRLQRRRPRMIEEPDFKGEDFSLFQLASQKCLEEGHIVQILDIIPNEKNKVIIKCMGWNPISPIIRCILCYKEEDLKRGECLKILDLLLEVNYYY